MKTCSKPSIKTLGKCVKLVLSYQYRCKNNDNDTGWVHAPLTLDEFRIMVLVSLLLISNASDGSRSSRQEVFCEKGIFKNSCNFIKKETLAQVFSCEFCEISKNTFSYRTAPVAAFVGHYHLH